MKRVLPFVPLLTLVTAFAAPGCSPAAQDDASAEDALSGFNGDRQRTCPTACASGLVCDDATKSCVAEPSAPRVLFPISGEVTSGLPEVRFTAGPGATGAVVEICSDAACAQLVARAEGSARVDLPSALPRGTYFLRAWGISDQSGHSVAGATLSPTIVFRSNGRPVASKAPLAFFADFDADGVGDKVDGSTGVARPQRRANEASAITLGGSPRAVHAVPDMDGDGRTELVELRGAATSSAKLVRSHLDAKTGALVEESIDLAADAKLLALGDVDGDGYFDLGAVRPTNAGARLEIVYGGPSGMARRATVDIRLPAEGGKALSFVSASAVGDLDGDGFPELAIGAQADWSEPPFAGSPTPKYLQGMAEGHRLFVLRGGQEPPYSETLTTLVREGDPSRGLEPVGDLNGDGVMDALALDPRAVSVMQKTPEAYGSARAVDVRRGIATVVYGGATLRKESLRSPYFAREGAAPSAGDGAYVYDDRGVSVVRTTKSGRVREEFYFAVWAAGGMDVDADGFGDLVYVMRGAEQPAPKYGDAWDTIESPDMLRDYTMPHTWLGTTTWHMFAAFAEAHYGSPQGLGQAAAQRILSPSIEASPPLVQWIEFPARIEPRWNGVLIAEAVKNHHMNPPISDASASQLVYAGAPGHLVPVP